VAKFRGITWDHPRGANALRAAAKRSYSGRDEPLIEWDVQPLEGFESHPISDLCSRYDLVVMDHPHTGEALASNCLQSLEQIFDAETLGKISAATIGSCFQSYNMADKHWALPLDAATQVMACRDDLLKQDIPRTWNEVVALSEKTGQVAMSWAGPHAFLSFLSIAHALDQSLDLRNSETWISKEVSKEAYEFLDRLHANSPISTSKLNPIGLLDYMAANKEVSLCPLIYGYVNYSAPFTVNKISFHNAPVKTLGGRSGSILGGTGIAISKRCRVNDELKEHLLWLMKPETQRVFIPDHDGQPSNRAAWRDDAVNDRWGEFYNRTFNTVQTASIRPRHDGYITFQGEASAYLRKAIEQKVAPDKATSHLQKMFDNSRNPL